MGKFSVFILPPGHEKSDLQSFCQLDRSENLQVQYQVEKISDFGKTNDTLRVNMQQMVCKGVHF